MKSLSMFLFAALAAVRLSSGAEPLALEKTIFLPNVQGRIDHLTYDEIGHRLFIAALGNNTVEVVDLEAAKVERSLTGFSEPQGVLFVATGRAFRSGTTSPLYR